MSAKQKQKDYRKNPNQNVHNLQHPKYNKLHAYCNTFNQIVPEKNCATQRENRHHTEHGSWIVFRNSFSLIWQISPFFLLNPHFLPSFVCSRFFLLFLEFCSSALIAWFLLLFPVVFVSRKKKKRKRENGYNEILKFLWRKL